MPLKEVAMSRGGNHGKRGSNGPNPVKAILAR
jgi:hypothetical protein